MLKNIINKSTDVDLSINYTASNFKKYLLTVSVCNTTPHLLEYNWFFIAVFNFILVKNSIFKRLKNDKS